MKNVILLLFGVLLQAVSFAQDSTLVEAEKYLSQLGTTFLTDTSEAKRVAAAEAVLPQLQSALASPNSFAYPFDSLQQLSIQYPIDSSFRIFSWQLYVNPNEYRYFGVIQMNQEELQLFPLQDGSTQVEDPEFEILDAETWYGSVYYNIKAFESPEGTQYLLFGYDGYQFFDKRKVVDVLRFREGQPVFGGPVFAKVEEGRSPITQNRLVREYSAASAIRCNYDEDLAIIIVDHMAPIRRPDGQGMSMIPDGTYEGYRYREDGLWVYEEKLFHEMLDDAPIPKPILNENKKDLFGN